MDKILQIDLDHAAKDAITDAHRMLNSFYTLLSRSDQPQYWKYTPEEVLDTIFQLEGAFPFTDPDNQNHN